MSPPLDLSNAPDQDLVDWAREGREGAYDELMRRYQRDVFDLIHRMVRNHELAEDLTQEAFFKAYNALESHPPERDFSAWMLKTANHVAVDHLRRKQLDTVPLDNSPDVTPPPNTGRTAGPVADRSLSTPTPPARVMARKVGPAFQQAIQRLEPKYRRVVILRHLEGRSYGDIAEILDLAEGTVRMRMLRARKELRKMLGPLLDSITSP